MEDDWFVRQVKLAGEGIGVILKKQTSSELLGEIEQANGLKISRTQAIMEHLKANRFEEAFLLVNVLKFKLSYYDFTLVSEWLIRLLNKMKSENAAIPLESETIESYSQRLNAFF